MADFWVLMGVTKYVFILHRHYSTGDKFTDMYL